VFAPIEDLGLIVVDEEHDASYKHEGDPRYDARDVAAERAVRCGALLLLGSATPRPESVRATPRPLRLPGRVDGRPLPEVQILDMRGETQGLHPLTARALAEVRSTGGKAMVLLNRRGWSNFLSCRSCAKVWGCPDCDVALVLHRSEGVISCHHCGHRERVPACCDACGSGSVARHGLGTERLEHELAAAAPSLGRPERAAPVEDAGQDALAVDAEPAAAGQLVQSGHDPGPVRPVRGRRLPRPRQHLVPIGGDQHRPGMAGAQQDHDCAHEDFDTTRQSPPL